MFLQNIDSTCKCSLAKDAIVTRDVSIHGDEDSDILVLHQHPYPQSVLNLLSLLFKKNGLMPENYGYLFAVGCMPSRGTIPNSFNSYYECKRSNTADKIKKFNPKVIIVEGNALYTMVENTYIKPEHFFNIKLLPSYFWSPEFNCWVVPIPELSELMTKDKNGHYAAYNNYPTNFTYYQIQLSQKIIDKQPPTTEASVIYVDDYNAFFDKWLQEDVIHKCAIDTETTGFSFFKNIITSVQFCFDGKVGYYLPWSKKRDFKIKLNKLMEKVERIVTANGLFDGVFLRYNHINTFRINSDVNYMGHFIYSGRGNSLKANTYYHTIFGGYENELDHYKRKYKIKDYSHIPDDVLSEYAGMDVVITYQLDDILPKYLTDQQLDLFYGTYIPLSNLFMKIELKGININLEELDRYRDEVRIKLKAIQEDFDKKYPGVNIGSNDQLGYLFRRLGATPYGLTKKGNYKVSEDVVSQWKQEGFEAAEQVLEYKKLSKILTSYLSNSVPYHDNRTVKDWCEDDDNSFLSNYESINFEKKSKRVSTLVDSIDSHGAAHPRFNFQKNWVGRLSADWAQTLPIKSNEKFRRMFEARQGKVLVQADLSGCHLRFVGIESGDSTMREIFTSSSRDMHSKTAAALFTGETLEEFNRKRKQGSEAEQKQYYEYRSTGKECNFALIYGMSFRTFCDRYLMRPIELGGWTMGRVETYLKSNGISNIHEIQDYLNVPSIKKKDIVYHKYLCASKVIVDKFFQEYKGIKEWIEYKHAKGKKDGYVDTWYGFRIWLPEYGYDFYEGREKQYANYKNVSVNGSIIGTEANIMQDMMLQMDDYFTKHNYDAYLINQVHDDVWIEMDENLIDELREPVKNIMTEQREIYNGIPVDAEGMYGKVLGGSSEHAWNLWFE